MTSDAVFHAVNTLDPSVASVGKTLLTLHRTLVCNAWKRGRTQLPARAHSVDGLGDGFHISSNVRERDGDLKTEPLVLLQIGKPSDIYLRQQLSPGEILNVVQLKNVFHFLQ